MNELQIFNSSEFGEIRTKKINGRTEVFHNGNLVDRFKLLAIACDEEDEDKAWEIMHITSMIFHPLDDKVFNSLYGAVAMEITREFHKNEFYYQELFKRNFSKIRKGKVIKNRNDGHNIPDAWVESNGYIIPVEVKLKSFDVRALEQLKRYMKAYGSEKGVAVARELSVEIPNNIDFIPFSELEAVNGK